jgi:putative transcriptional regulator
LTQAAFAERIATPVATLRDWEQGRFAPPGGVVCLLKLIIKHPELSQELSVA